MDIYNSSIKFLNGENGKLLSSVEQHFYLEAEDKEEAPILKTNSLNNMSLFLPCYNNVLAQGFPEGVSIEELDKLQSDLEYLLSNVVLQQKSLNFERNLLKHLPNGQMLKEIMQHFIPKKRHKVKKKVNHTLSEKTFSTSNKHRKRDVPRTTIIKNETSDRYWLAVEPLCGDITKDNIVFLDSMIRECSRNTEVTVPEAREHFALKWAETILDKEQSFSNNRKDHSLPVELQNDDTHRQQKNYMQSPLKQHLSKAFIEDIHTTQHKNSKFSTEVEAKTNSRFHTKLRQEFLKKHLAMRNFEAREGEHELLFEIKKSISQLQLVNEHNLKELNSLKGMALMDLHKQETKELLDRTDEDIISLYNKIVNCKENKVVTNSNGGYATINTEDAEMASKLIQQHCNLQKQLTDFTVSIIY